MRPIWKNHWLLFRSTHSQKSPEKRDFVVHTQKATAVLLFFYVVRDFATMLHHALRGEPRHTRLTLVFFLQDNLHDSLLRKPLGFLRVPEDAPSVMVYKSFLVDHHFCIFRGIFTPF